MLQNSTGYLLSNRDPETTEHVVVIKPSMSLSYPVPSFLYALSVSHKSQSCHSADEDKSRRTSCSDCGTGTNSET